MKIRVAVAAIVLSAMSALTMGPAAAAPPTAVDFTIAETIPTSGPGTLAAGSIPGCTGAMVTTENLVVDVSGDRLTFSGDKRIACAEGEIVLSFSARVNGCADSDRGSWEVASGTGDFAGLSGKGRLLGTYTGGDACTATGILDNYIGKFRLG